MNDIAKASLQRSWYEVIRRKKDPAVRAALYDMAFGYLYENIEPDEDSPYYDLFLSWRPQMDFELQSKLSGKRGQAQRMETLERSFSSSSADPKLGFSKPQIANVNDNVNVNVKENAHVNVNVNGEAPAENGGEGACGNGACAVDTSVITGEAAAGETQDWGKLQKDAFEAIEAHNRGSPYSRKIFISPDLIQFSQKECRELVSDLRGHSPEEIMRALRNYIAVSELKDTWKKGFSLRNFTGEFPKWADRGFTLDAYRTGADRLDKARDPPPEEKKPVHVWRRCSVCGAVYPYAHVLCEKCMEHDGAAHAKGGNMYESPYARRLEVVSGEKMPAGIEEADNDRS